MGLTCFFSAETLRDVYCKPEPSLPETECVVGLGDERVTAWEVKTIINGTCSPETYYIKTNLIVLVSDYCEAIFSVCLGKFIFIYFAMNNTKITTTWVRFLHKL